jgi:hypothetical protein
MSDFLHIKDWRKFKVGELVRVRVSAHPPLNRNFRLTRILISSNFPFRINYKGREQLLRKDEVSKI